MFHSQLVGGTAVQYKTIYDRITIIPNEEITSASVYLLNPTRGQILQHTFQNGMYVEINASTYGVSGLTVDGVVCPSVPQGEVHKFIFYPYHGGFSRIG